MNRPLVIACVAAVAVATGAAAQEAPSPVALELNLGFVNTSGNTDVTTFNLGEKLTYTRGRWVFTEMFKALYGETDSSPSAETYDGLLRAEYELTERLAVFGFAGWFRNTFSGIASRWSEGAGLGYKAIDAPRDTLIIEDALMLEQERTVAGLDESFTLNRAALAYRHVFRATATFAQDLEWLANFEHADDQRLNSETALTAPISKQISLKLSYVVRFDNEPEPGFEKTDRTFTTGLQIVF